MANQKSSASVSCLKIILTIFNIIFLMTGIVMLVIGILAKISLQQYLKLSTTNFEALPVVQITIGVIIIVVGFLGCCCTCRSYARMLYVYAAILIIITIGEIVITIVAFAYRNKLESGFDTGLRNAMQVYKSNSTYQETIDKLQINMLCCSHDKYDDWFSIAWSSSSLPTNSVPSSCCVESNCKNTDLPPSSAKADVPVYTEGCYVKVTTFIHNNLVTIGATAAAFAIFQLFGAILSCCLGKSVQKQNSYQKLS